MKYSFQFWTWKLNLQCWSTVPLWILRHFLKPANQIISVLLWKQWKHDHNKPCGNTAYGVWALILIGTQTQQDFKLLSCSNNNQSKPTSTVQIRVSGQLVNMSVSVASLSFVGRSIDILHLLKRIETIIDQQMQFTFKYLNNLWCLWMFSVITGRIAAAVPTLLP